ncbi:MAG TPA: DUF2306 domain-containing protein [Allosphingosinicella sp.]|nr:DUF2306 domain-containing protein [Allosphingosinicella sp.]
MTRTFAPIYPAAARAIILLLTVEIAIVSGLRYFTGSMAPPPPILANAFANPYLLLHVIGGVTALVVAPLQFLPKVRSRWPGLHRKTGRIYLAACAVGAPAGFMLALGTTAGPVAAVGFAIPAVLWALFTWVGWRAAVERRFDDHREWMLRSYALTATAITLRLMLPASAFMGFEFLPAYRVISWLGWITNLALFEYYIRRKRASAAAGPVLAVA